MKKAQEKVFSQLGRWKKLKSDGRKVIIGVGGCVASQEGAAIIKRAPFVDLVFGPQTLHRLPEMIETVRDTGKPAVDISFPEIEKFDNLPAAGAKGPSAFVSISKNFNQSSCCVLAKVFAYGDIAKWRLRVYSTRFTKAVLKQRLCNEWQALYQDTWLSDERVRFRQDGGRAGGISWVGIDRYRG